MVFNFKSCTLSKENHDDHVTLGLKFMVLSYHKALMSLHTSRPLVADICLYALKTAQFRPSGKSFKLLQLYPEWPPNIYFWPLNRPDVSKRPSSFGPHGWTVQFYPDRPPTLDLTPFDGKDHIDVNCGSVDDRENIWRTTMFLERNNPRWKLIDTNTQTRINWECAVCLKVLQSFGAL